LPSRRVIVEMGGKRVSSKGKKHNIGRGIVRVSFYYEESEAQVWLFATFRLSDFGPKLVVVGQVGIQEV